MPFDPTMTRLLREAKPFVERHHGERPVRCWYDGRILGTVVDFSGQLNLRCHSCKKYTLWAPDQDTLAANQSADRRNTRLVHAMIAAECHVCSKVLFWASRYFSGTVYRRCRSCQVISSIEGHGYRKTALAEMDPDSFMALMEERWQELWRACSRRRAEVAVGLRFDVFKRDGFRCRYCGAAAEDGAVLHADHVIPQSKGGPTTLENLVTACFACNIGKSDKDAAPTNHQMC